MRRFGKKVTEYYVCIGMVEADVWLFKNYIGISRHFGWDRGVISKGMEKGYYQRDGYIIKRVQLL